jgi:hypothetical protein
MDSSNPEFVYSIRFSEIITKMQIFGEVIEKVFP